MATTSETAGEARPTRPLATQIRSWHWNRPVLLGCILLVVLLGAIAAIHSWSGGAASSASPDDGLVNHLSRDIVFSLVSAYTLGVGLISVAGANRALDRLRPLVRVSEPDFDVYRDRLAPQPRTIGFAAGLGGLFGAGLQFSPLLLRPVVPGELILHSTALMMLQFALLGVMALITLRQSRVFFDVGRDEIDVDLLDLESLTPFASVGLTTAAAWLIGSAIASFLMASGANAFVVVAVLVATLGLGFAGLIVPSRGLHLRLKEAKQRELARVRGTIRAERDLLFQTEEASRESPRMAGMLAYESRIDGVREWPFDVVTLRRFGIFLLIPLVSWIGGALVERLVDAALG